MDHYAAQLREIQAEVDFPSPRPCDGLRQLKCPHGSGGETQGTRGRSLHAIRSDGFRRSPFSPRPIASILWIYAFARIGSSGIPGTGSLPRGSMCTLISATGVDMSSPDQFRAQIGLKIGSPLMRPFKAAIRIDLEVQINPHALVCPVRGYVVNGKVFASSNRRGSSPECLLFPLLGPRE